MRLLRTIPVAITNSSYSLNLSSFEGAGFPGFTLVVGVELAQPEAPHGERCDPQRVPNGLVDNEAHMAFAMLSRDEYKELWKGIWASHSGEIHIFQNDWGRLKLDYKPDPRNCR